MKRSKHSLSHYKLLSCDQGQLVPIGLMEVLPGDSIQHATSILTRVQPLLAPLMHPVHIRVHHWFVPHRLVWDDWEDFITGGPDGDDDSEFPTIDMGGSGAAVSSLADYLGVPTGVAGLDVSALPFRGYALIFNEWYRDQDLVSQLAIDTTSGVDTTTSTTLQNVAWEKDYFTSARPWAQKGPEITIPLGTSAPVLGETSAPTFRGSSPTTDRTLTLGTDGKVGYSGTAVGSTQSVWWGTDPNLYADLSNATAASINLLREAFALQRYEEARARYGSRYTEYLRYLGVRSSDARLQRPEYLGGGKQTLQISEVLQTGVTTAGSTDGVGNLKGHGISALRSNRYRRFFEEHGYVFSLLSVKPKTIYANGLPRTWNRRTKEDFWQRELQHIGQQEVLNKEVYASHTSPDGTFGFQDRYDEYRRIESSIAGEFRSTLNFWHMARIFSSDPALNEDFVKSNPTTRIYPAPSADQLYIMAAHSIQARRLVAGAGTSYIY
ncbi:MAG: major capsid protein [Arizlama microvirus]|nr:MAG: major capsid protein [Arizlama microvirus]